MVKDTSKQNGGGGPKHSGKGDDTKDNKANGQSGKGSGGKGSGGKK
jgi:hypothetical protein